MFSITAKNLLSDASMCVCAIFACIPCQQSIASLTLVGLVLWTVLVRCGRFCKRARRRCTHSISSLLTSTSSSEYSL